MRKSIKADVNKVVGYLRVSTDDQNLGIDSQRSTIERWCQANKATLVAVFVDHGVSGAAAIDKRPGLLQALAAVRENGAGVLICAKRDRLARDVVLAAMIERLLERDGATVKTADGSSDGEGPEGQLMRGIVDVFAQYERALIRARTKAALAVKKSRNEKTGGDVPYGYRLSVDGIRLDVNPDEQRAVELVRQYNEQGLSLRAIARQLDVAAVLPRTGKAWHPEQVRRVLAGIPCQTSTVTVAA